MFGFFNNIFTSSDAKNVKVADSRKVRAAYESGMNAVDAVAAGACDAAGYGFDAGAFAFGTVEKAARKGRVVCESASQACHGKANSFRGNGSGNGAKAAQPKEELHFKSPNNEALFRAVGKDVYGKIMDVLKKEAAARHRYFNIVAYKNGIVILDSNGDKFFLKVDTMQFAEGKKAAKPEQQKKASEKKPAPKKEAVPAKEDVPAPSEADAPADEEESDQVEHVEQPIQNNHGETANSRQDEIDTIIAFAVKPGTPLPHVVDLGEA